MPNDTKLPSKYDNTPDESIIAEIDGYEKEIKGIKKKIDVAKDILTKRRQDEIKEKYAAKDEPFGDIAVMVGDRKVKFTTSKKVEWNQDKLGKIYLQIASDPEEDVSDYIGVEYKVAENAYKNWPKKVQTIFQDARTVTPGKMAIKIEDEKEQ